MILEAFVAREQCNGGVVLEHTNCLDEDVWAGILNLIACIDSELVDPLGVECSKSVSFALGSSCCL